MTWPTTLICTAQKNKPLLNVKKLLLLRIKNYFYYYYVFVNEWGTLYLYNGNLADHRETLKTNAESELITTIIESCMTCKWMLFLEQPLNFLNCAFDVWQWWVKRIQHFCHCQVYWFVWQICVCNMYVKLCYKKKSTSIYHSN